MSDWKRVQEQLPPEGELVDVWLERGRRVADCYYELKKQGQYEMPYWHYRNGFGVWKPFHDQDVTHWMVPPDGPDGESSVGERDEPYVYRSRG